MKTYQIKYQSGTNILLDKVEAPNELSARYEFYMKYPPGVDIIEIKEIKKEK